MKSVTISVKNGFHIHDEYTGKFYECPQCEEYVVYEDTNYCPHCGVKIVWDATE